MSAGIVVVVVVVFVVVGETSCAAPQVDFLPFLTQVNFSPLTIFMAPAGEQLKPGFGAVDAEVELTASASTKTVEAEIVASRFKRCLPPS